MTTVYVETCASNGCGLDPEAGSDYCAFHDMFEEDAPRKFFTLAERAGDVVAPGFHGVGTHTTWERTAKPVVRHEPKPTKPPRVVRPVVSAEQKASQRLEWRVRVAGKHVPILLTLRVSGIATIEMREPAAAVRFSKQLRTQIMSSKLTMAWGWRTRCVGSLIVIVRGPQEYPDHGTEWEKAARIGGRRVLPAKAPLENSPSPSERPR